MIPGISWDVVINSTRVEGRIYEITLKQGKIFKYNLGVNVGDFLTIHPRFLTHQMLSHPSIRYGRSIFLRETEKVTFNNVTVHASQECVINSIGGEGGNIYNNFRIVRRPGSDRLMVSNAGGFKSSSLGVGPTIVNSEFSFTADDLIDVNNVIGFVYKEISSTEYILLDPTHIFMKKVKPSDVLKFYTFKEMNYIASYTVDSISPINNKTMIEQAKMLPEILKKRDGTVIRDIHGLTLWHVSFTSPLEGVEIYNFIQFDYYSNSFAYIANNHFHDGQKANTNFFHELIFFRICYRNEIEGTFSYYFLLTFFLQEYRIQSFE